MTAVSTSAAHNIRLAATTVIRDGAALKEALLPLLQSPDPVVIDVTDVEQVDTAVLQLLFAFSRDRKSLGRSVLWQGDSPAWRSAAAILDPDADTSAVVANV